MDGNAPYCKNQLTLWLENCAMWCSGRWLKGSPQLSEIERTFCSFFLNSIVHQLLDYFVEEPDVVKEYGKLIASAKNGQLKDF